MLSYPRGTHHPLFSPASIADPGHRIGLIDCGSNAVRAAVAELGPDGPRVIKRIRRPLRLGGDVFARGSISRPLRARAIAAFAEFAELFHRLGVKSRIAVATSALRNAQNKTTFVERIRRETGIDLVLISASEEAELVRQAVFIENPSTSSIEAIADLGGGSLEVQLLAGGELVASANLPVGTVRLGEHQSISPSRAREIEDTVTQGLSRSLGDCTYPLSTLTLCGGNAKALAKIYPGRLCRGHRSLDGRALENELAYLCRLTAKGRKAALGIRLERAEVIASAAVVYTSIWRWFGNPILVVPGIGVLDGLLAMAAHFPPPRHRRTLS